MAPHPPINQATGAPAASRFAHSSAQPPGRPLPAERAAEAIRSALEHDRQLVYVPRWMSFPARLHGAAPRTFAVLARWFGDHG